MKPELHSLLLTVLERPHRLGMIGGDLEEQLAHCASFSSVLTTVVGAEGPRWAVDLGTGGGLPGVALAALWPESKWDLVDTRAARLGEVERSVLRLGLQNTVSTIVEEAQQLAHDADHRERYDLVVARAFGKPSLTAECAAGLIEVNGHAIISEPPQSGPSRWDDESLGLLGFQPARPVQHGIHHFAVLTKIAATPTNVPRTPARPNRGWYGG